MSITEGGCQVIRITRGTFGDKSCSYTLFINGVDRGEIKSGETKEFSVENGKHTVLAKMDHHKSNELCVDVEGSIVDIKVGVSLRGWEDEQLFLRKGMSSWQALGRQIYPVNEYNRGLPTFLAIAALIFFVLGIILSIFIEGSRLELAFFFSVVFLLNIYLFVVGIRASQGKMSGLPRLVAVVSFLFPVFGITQYVFTENFYLSLAFLLVGVLLMRLSLVWVNRNARRKKQQEKDDADV